MNNQQNKIENEGKKLKNLPQMEILCVNVMCSTGDFYFFFFYIKHKWNRDCNSPHSSLIESKCTTTFNYIVNRVEFSSL